MFISCLFLWQLAVKALKVELLLKLLLEVLLKPLWRATNVYTSRRRLSYRRCNKTDSLREYIATESGFWYTLTQKDSTTSNQKPAVGDLITFTYNVKDLAGNVIVSAKENGIQTYKVDQSNQDLISGIRDGVKLLSPGEKATFIFPSYKAYGYYGIEKKLGTNEPITSDITLLSINQNQ